MSTIENSERLLKSKVQQWWDKHPMDYLNWTWDGRIINTEQERRFFRNIDNELRNAAFFAQKSHQDPLFSLLIPYPELVGKYVLEVGCGLGAHSSEMSKNGAYVTAIDLTRKAIFVTKERFKIYDLSGNLCQADAELLPFDKDSFDFIWSWGVLHHTPDTAMVIREIHRVLKRGGEVRIMWYNRHSIMTLLTIIKGGKKNFMKHALMGTEKIKQYMQSLRNKYTDGESLGGKPLAKYYSKKEVKILFKEFRKVRISVYSQKSDLISLGHRFFRKHESLSNFVENLPDWVFNMINNRVGFFLFIKAIK